MRHIITRNSRHLKTTLITIDQYPRDPLTKNTKSDITDDMLRTREENRYSKEGKSYNIHM